MIAQAFIASLLTSTATVSYSEDDDDESATNHDNEYIVIDDDDDEEHNGAKGSSNCRRANFDEEALPEVVELPSHRLETGGVLHQRDTVELIDRTERVANHTLSGDFLRITAIVEDLQSHEIYLKGYCLRRCSYLRPLFDGECPLNTGCRKCCKTANHEIHIFPHRSTASSG